MSTPLDCARQWCRDFDGRLAAVASVMHGMERGAGVSEAAGVVLFILGVLLVVKVDETS
jgi:hypothetical protein